MSNPLPLGFCASYLPPTGKKKSKLLQPDSCKENDWAVESRLHENPTNQLIDLDGSGIVGVIITINRAWNWSASFRLTR